MQVFLACCVSLYTLHLMLHTLPPLLPPDPIILPQLQVDKGAIKFILSGANIMCPGLTSPGARMDVSLPEDTIVVSSPLIYTPASSLSLSLSLSLSCHLLS